MVIMDFFTTRTTIGRKISMRIAVNLFNRTICKRVARGFDWQQKDQYLFFKFRADEEEEEAEGADNQKIFLIYMSPEQLTPATDRKKHILTARNTEIKLTLIGQIYWIQLQLDRQRSLPTTD